MRDHELEVARSVVQCGVLEQQLWKARTAEAVARRHRGELVGVLVGALADDALTPAYRALARTTIERVQAERDC